MRTVATGTIRQRWFTVSLVFLLTWSWSAISACAALLYVSNGSDGRIEKFSTSGGDSTVAYYGLHGARGIAFDPAGNLYVADSVIGGASTIEKFTPAGVRSTFFTYGYGYPEGIAFDRTGNLYEAGANTNRMLAVSPEGNASIFTAFSSATSYSGMAFDAAGNLYVASNGNFEHAIYKISPAGVRSVFTTRAGQPHGLAFDYAGNLYVADYGNREVLKFTPGNIYPTIFANLGPQSRPHGLAFDDDGNLFVSSHIPFSGSAIMRYTPEGVGSVFAAAAPIDREYLAFTDDNGVPLPLPEPTALPLLLLGISVFLTGRPGSQSTKIA